MPKDLLETVGEADWSSYRKKLKDRAVGSLSRPAPRRPKKEREYGNRRALKWLNRKLGLPDLK